MFKLEKDVSVSRLDYALLEAVISEGSIGMALKIGHDKRTYYRYDEETEEFSTTPIEKEEDVIVRVETGVDDITKDKVSLTYASYEDIDYDVITDAWLIEDQKYVFVPFEMIKAFSLMKRNKRVKIVVTSSDYKIMSSVRGYIKSIGDSLYIYDSEKELTIASYSNIVDMEEVDD